MLFDIKKGRPTSIQSHQGRATDSDTSTSALLEETRDRMSNLSFHPQKASSRHAAANLDANLRDRYYTFNNRWPKHLKGFLLEQNLALAGFVYTGKINITVDWFGDGLSGLLCS